MSKKFTTKERRLRARAEARRRNLKVNPQVKGKKESLAEKNRPVILALEAKVKEAQAEQ